MKYRAFRQNDANAQCAIALRVHDTHKAYRQAWPLCTSCWRRVLNRGDVSRQVPAIRVG